MVENEQTEAQMELIDLQHDDNLLHNFNNSNLLIFNQCLRKEKYPLLVDNALKCAFYWDRQIICEQIFFITNNFNNSKTLNVQKTKMLNQFYVCLQKNVSNFVFHSRFTTRN